MQKKNSGIKIFAPASVGNVICGFDVLGLAVKGVGDEVIAYFKEKPGLEIVHISGAKGKLPYEIKKNTAGLAAWRLLEHLEKTDLGIALELRKKMPIGSGLGSSAASAVAGAMAINELLKRPLEKRELLPFALAGEALAIEGQAHADNIAPSLLGGITLVRSSNPPDVQRLPVIPGLHLSLLSPALQVLTKEARGILSDAIPLKDFVRQSANLGAFVAALYRQDFQLLQRSLEDFVIEPQRASLIPQFYSLKEAALEAGALGCSISGAGPAVFALSANSLVAEEVKEAMSAIWTRAGIDHQAWVTEIDMEGAKKM